jgi:plastocyanin
MSVHLARLSTRIGLAVAVAALVVIGGSVPILAESESEHGGATVKVPAEDRFTPFAVTIHAGQTVEWVNADTDDHTVVSDDAFNTAGHKGVDHLVRGTDSNHGTPGRFSLRFNHPGTFVYYCRFHAHLDSAKQPAAPGPRGGITDANGNLGTPMMGIVTVLDD